jgi:hypothetical protein
MQALFGRRVGLAKDNKGAQLVGYTHIPEAIRVTLAAA